MKQYADVIYAACLVVATAAGIYHMIQEWREFRHWQTFPWWRRPPEYARYRWELCIWYVAAILVTTLFQLPRWFGL